MNIKSFLYCIVFVLFQNSWSQEVDELIELRRVLTQRKEVLNVEILKVSKSLDSVEQLILFARIKEKSIPAIVKSKGGIYKEIYDPVEKIADVEKSQVVYIVDYKPYAKSFEVIYDNQIGYLKSKYVKISKPLKEIIARSSSIKNQKSLNTNTRNNRIYSRAYIRGPRGGCYYINSKGKKTYVSRNLCN
ncbi:MAG: hypothetical protein CL613_06255 [Aquimarina sp.]|nr:hypothetical protein [Aquimarina sp.]